mgnify:CR=1 FL=1
MVQHKKKVSQKIKQKFQFLDVCDDIEQWPKSWKGLDEDIPIGESMIPVFRDFIQSLIEKGLRKKTVQKHVDNLWSLGGEIVAEVNMYEDYNGEKGRQLILKNIDELGGPYCKHALNI